MHNIMYYGRLIYFLYLQLGDKWDKQIIVTHLINHVNIKSILYWTS